MINKQHAVIMWVIWFAQLQGAFLIQMLIGGGLPEGKNVAQPMPLWLWLICFGPILMATAIRWLVIPKLKDRQGQLIAMLVGLALAEAPVLLQLFLLGPDYPQNQIAVLMVSVVALIQFAPSYATPGYKMQKTE